MESKKSTMISEYLNKFPKLPSSSLAKLIYNKDTELFKNSEEVRTLIRYRRGALGKKQLQQLKDKTFVVPHNSLNKYALPKGRSTKQKYFTLPKEANNILFISDLHIPYHDVAALTCALDYGKSKKINTIFINGDLIDFYPISRFTNVKRKSTLQEELDTTKEILSIFKKQFPKAKIYFLYGNHDNRLEHYLATKAPELLGTTQFLLEELLEFKKFGIQHFEDNTLVKIGKLMVTHGHLLIKGIFAPVNPARGAFLRAKDSIIISHVHNPSSHTEKTIKGKIIATYSTGCMCELNPDYNPFGNNFGHGFAHITVEDNGEYHIDNKRIIDGKIY